MGLLVLPESVREARRISRLHHEGLRIRAQIVRIAEESRSSDTNTLGNSPILEVATVRYAVAGMQYQGQHPLRGPIHSQRPGDAITVLVLPEEPWRSYADYAVPGTWIMTLLLPAMLLGGAGALAGIGSLLRSSSRARASRC